MSWGLFNTLASVAPTPPPTTLEFLLLQDSRIRKWEKGNYLATSPWPLKGKIAEREASNAGYPCEYLGIICS